MCGPATPHADRRASASVQVRRDAPFSHGRELEMNRISITATSIATEPPITRAADEQRWINVVFLQGETGDTVLDLIDEDGPQAAIEHLSQWDYGDETRDAALVNGYVYDEIPQSATDSTVRDDITGYALTYNHHFRYVSLLRHFDAVVEAVPEPVPPAARRGFGRQRTARRANGLQL